MRSLVLTVIGPDRPGLVEAIARVALEAGGNWLESRMSRLGGKFAGIVHLEVPAERAEELTANLGALEKDGLSIIVQTQDVARGHNVRTVRLELVGNDRTGIVRDITRALAAQNVNVEELSTECNSAPMSAIRLFRAEARLRVPEAVSLDALQRGLEDIAHDLMVDLHDD